MSHPCTVCNRMHLGRRCKPADQRSVAVCVTLPTRVHAQLVQHVPWGERSGWVARLVERELNGGDAGASDDTRKQVRQ